MVYVILRNGKVIKYNHGGAIAVVGNTFAIESLDEKGEISGLVARIPMDIVERVEFNKPCDILIEKKKRRRYY